MFWNKFQFGVLRNPAEDIEDSPHVGGSDGDDEPGGEPDKGGKDEGDKGGRSGGKGKDHRDAELATLREQLRERETSERYWADKYKTDIAERPAPRAEELDDDDDGFDADEDPTKFADDIGTLGVKALQKRGLVTKKQLDRAVKQALEKHVPDVARRVAKEEVTSATSELSESSKLASDFPDLLDAKSPLFQRTQQILIEEFGQRGLAAAVKDGRSMRMAARAAQAELGAKGESDREDRIRRQAGDRGRGGRSFEDEGDDNLDSVQREGLSSILKTVTMTKEQRDRIEKGMKNQRGGRS